MTIITSINQWIEAKRWRTWLFIATMVLVIVFTLTYAFAEGGNGTSNEGGGWGSRSTEAELSFKRGTGIVAMATAAYAAYKLAKEFGDAQQVTTLDHVVAGPGYRGEEEVASPINQQGFGGTHDPLGADHDVGATQGGSSGGPRGY